MLLFVFIVAAAICLFCICCYLNCITKIDLNIGGIFKFQIAVCERVRIYFSDVITVIVLRLFSSLTQEGPPGGEN